MVVNISGLNKARDLINASLTTGKCGTGTSTATAEDTGLDVEQAATSKTLVNNLSDRLITTTFSLSSAEGNGLQLTEFGNFFSTGEMLARIRHTPISKDNTKEFNFVCVFELKGE